MTIQRVYNTFQQKGLAGELARANAPFDFDNAVVAAAQTIRPGEGVYLVSSEWVKPTVGNEELITHVASFECATVGTAITAPTTNDDLEIVFGAGDIMKALALGSIYVVAGTTVSKGDLAIFDATDDQWDIYTHVPAAPRAAAFVFLNDAVDGDIVEIRNCGCIR